MNSLFIIMGTNKYFDLALECMNTVRTYGYALKPKFAVFTNRHLYSNPLHDVSYQYISHLPWPLITLMRYHNILEHMPAIEKDLGTKPDYIYYIDADLHMINKVGEEICGELTATIHPGYHKLSKHVLPFERRTTSTAFLYESDIYYYGGFQGGSYNGFLKACQVIAKNISQDLKNNVIAAWHDESHWNKYCFQNKPTTILSPDYAWPYAITSTTKIRAIDKDHISIRKENYE